MADIKQISLNGSIYDLVDANANHGKNIAAWSSNVSNCLTFVPKNIEATLLSGTLTLKAGSKVYVPNGSDVFDEVTVTEDRSITNSANDTRLYFYNRNGNFDGYDVTHCYSGSTQPSGQTYMFWYDTANNIVKRTTDGGSTWNSGWSLPLLIATSTDGAISSIDRICEGFGYIGGTIFALPDVEVLVPEGRDEEGSLKSAKVKLSKVQTLDVSGTYTRSLFITDIATLNATSNYYEYDPVANLNFVNSNHLGWGYIGTVTTVSDTITALYTKTVFHAVDFNDMDYIANCAMPSEKYVNLTLGTSGDSYIAPADGYFTITKQATASNEYIYMRNGSNGMNSGVMATGSSNCRVYLPAAKGQSVSVSYTVGGTTSVFRFVYANGAK